MNLTGDDEGTIGAGFAVGAGGRGTMNVTGGAAVSVAASATSPGTSGIRVGGSRVFGAGGTGALTVCDNGSLIDVVGSDVSLDVGFDMFNGTKPSTGTLTICAGAKLTLDAPGRASLGATAGSQGTAAVDGSGSLLDAGAFLGIARDIDDRAAGRGTLTVSNGGTAKALTIHCGNNGTINGDGGTLIGDVVIEPGCNLDIGSSPGSMTVVGSYAQLGGRLLFEVGANGNHDVLAIVGTAGFDPSIGVEVRIDPDFHPAGGVVLPLVTLMDSSQIQHVLLAVTVLEAGVPTVQAQGDLAALARPIDVVPAIPVAILGTPATTATDIDPQTVRLNAAPVKLAGQGARPLCESRDVNGDGLIDLVCQVLTDQFQIQEGEAFAELEARTQTGVPVRGSDFIRIVP